MILNQYRTGILAFQSKDHICFYLHLRYITGKGLKELEDKEGGGMQVKNDEQEQWRDRYTISLFYEI